jgi:hypothetical protein
VVFLLRWMGTGGTDRFWLGAFALAVPLIGYFCALWARRSPVVAALVIVLMIWTVHPSLRNIIGHIDNGLRHPTPAERLDSPYHHVVPLLDPGSVVFLVAYQGTRDYALFLPRQGYPNRVITWGQMDYDQERLADLIERNAVTHAVIEYDRNVGLHGRGMHTRPFALWLESNPAFVEVPLPPQDPRPEGQMRLFRRHHLPDLEQP